MKNTMVPIVAVLVMAGSFEGSDFVKRIPDDKKLDPAWVTSLFARGEKTVYRGAELKQIGMPVGGICAGQLYLGGDGRLWHWDIFANQYVTGSDHYAAPMQPASPLEQGFGIKLTVGGASNFRALDRRGFSDIRFRGEYPIAQVEYRDPASPVTVSLEAFSPFVPLSTETSSLPATVMHYTVKNVGPEKLEAEVYGWLQNAVCLERDPRFLLALRRNCITRQAGVVLLECSAAAAHPGGATARPNVVFENFQKETYEGWEVTGTAFGKGPILKSQIPAYQGDVGSPGPRVVNSHATAPGNDIGSKDGATGKLTSKPFVIKRNFINFWIGGGNQPGTTCVNLRVDEKAVRTATGHDGNQMRREAFDVRDLQGKTARLEIVDNASGAWGNIGVAEIVFSDTPPQDAGNIRDLPDFGTMALGLLGSSAGDIAMAAVVGDKLPAIVPAGTGSMAESAEVSIGQQLVGALGRKLSLAPGQEARVAFVVAWHFPNRGGGRFYATRFQNAAAAAGHVAKNFDTLSRQTRLWRDTWYDSTLPYWFLDRTMANTSILATSTCNRFANGQFYGFEGVGCCEGTCTHVWHYAQAVGRLFPELERDLRRRTDFGTALDPNSGVIDHRGGGYGLAVDGQAGCILRAYREHQMSANREFLKELWPKIRLAMQCLVRMDDGKGLLEGAQHNTLDQPWFGKVAWLSSLYVAAARACEEMAREIGDTTYAAEMRQIVERGGRSIDRELFNGEYYYQIADKDHAQSVGSHNGCEIDQVFGQSWAYQVGLGRILNEGNVKKALASLWKYNFMLDVGPFRKQHEPGRWYAMAGEGGLLMCSWPRGEAARVQTGFDFYFNECMTGFEYQAAGHMIWEGMVLEGLAVTRTIHDRYHASRRNPWNEIECGDHYARSMASYGVFLAACGYRYHGPKGFLAFAPRLTPENFRAPFTTAEGWGTFSQQRDGKEQRETLELKWGKLRLRSLAFDVPQNTTTTHVRVAAQTAFRHHMDGETVIIELADDVVLEAGQKLEVVITW